MAAWHLINLRTALERRGWRIVAEHKGNGYNISGTWEIVRSPFPTHVVLDFAGLDGDGNLLPLDQSYACSVRTAPMMSLYFGNRRARTSDRRARWLAQLTTFVADIEQLAAEESPHT